MSQRVKNQKKAPPANQPGSFRGPPGLLSALEETGRIRGSSATPKPPDSTPKPNLPISKTTTTTHHPATIQSPTPISPGQPLIRRMEAMNFSGIDVKGGKDKIKDDETVKGREKSDGTQDKLSGDNSLPQKPATIQELTVELESHISELVVQVSNSKLSKNAQRDTISSIHALAAQVRYTQTRLLGEVERIQRERDHFEGRLVITASNLKDASAARDQSRIENQFMRHSLQNLREKYKQAETDLEESRNKFKSECDRMRLQLLHKDEQLKGKRALWLEHNPSASAQRTAMTAIHDPFESPLAKNGKAGKGRGKATPSTVSPFSSFGSAAMGNVTSPSPFGTPFSSFESGGSHNAPQMTTTEPRSRPKLPYGTAKPAPESVQFPVYNDPSRYITHTGNTVINHGAKTEDSPMSPNRGALVLFNNRPDRSPEFQDEITQIYVLVEGWVRQYANLVNPAGNLDIVRNKPDVWAYMMNCTFPGNAQDARTHTTMLMNDPDARFWFIMRMIANYVFMEMIGINAWHEFDTATAATLDDVAQKLQERGLANEQRHELVVRRAEAIKSIVNSGQYQDWRSKQLHHHTKELRDLLGPVLNPDSDRSKAGRDLGVLAIRVWDQSAKMNNADLTFQIYFPATGGKYNAGSMIAKDKAHVDPLALQVRQLRIKLAITPVVTLRDDGGLSIKAKNLHHACVLVMH